MRLLLVKGMAMMMCPVCKTLDKLYTERLGEQDYAELQRIHHWIDTHPQRSLLVAYFNEKDPYSLSSPIRIFSGIERANMANPEHLKLIKQGVAAFNQWREQNPKEKLDLREANLSGVVFRNADLRETDFYGSNLQRANLSGSILYGSNLLRGNLRRANLSRTDLRRASFNGADLSGADLSGADLRGGNLRTTYLIKTNLRKADISGAYLYGTARDDWEIDDIRCRYVFWEDKPWFSSRGEEHQWELEHRVPKDRDFRPGEFEELYKQLPTFDYLFEHGFTALDAVVMNRVVEAVHEEHPEFELKLDSFQSRGQPHVRFTVLHKEAIEEAKRQLGHKYETQIKLLEGQKDLLLEQFNNVIGQIVSRPQLQGQNIQLFIGETTMGDSNQYHAGRDINKDIHHSQLTTGDSFQGDYAQKLLQTTTTHSSQEDIRKLLAFVLQELPKLALPEEVKEEVANEVKGAEIQAKKDAPDKKKLADKLKNATTMLKESASTAKEAVTIGNLLGQAILWCGEQWTTWGM